MEDTAKLTKSNYFSIKLPEYRKAKVELWRYLNPNNMDTLIACFEIDDWDEFLASLNQSEARSMHELTRQRANASKDLQYQIFCRLISTQLNLDLNKATDMILIDKYYYLIKFSLANAYNKVQINALISIIKRTHELAIETSFGNLDETFDFFKNLLIAYCVHEPPHSLNVFTAKQIEAVIEYFVNSYFKSFKFYKYVFSPAVLLDINFSYTNMPANVVPDLVVDTLHPEDHAGKDHKMFLESKIEEEEEEEPAEGQQRQMRQENGELKEFVKSFLVEKLGRMKNDLISDITTGKHTPVKSAGKNKNKSPEAKSPTKKK